jgi:membrane associated rhomboid family serine protease
MKNTSLGRDMRLALMANSALNKLIIANVIIAATVLISYTVTVIALPVTHQRAWASALEWIGLPLTAQNFFTHIYSVFIYMFVPVHPIAFLTDMLILWTFGRRFAEFMGGKRLFPIFFYSGITGALVSFAAYQLLHNSYWIGSPYLFGATASVMGVMFAVAFLYPNLPLNLVFFGPVKLKYIALVYFLVITACLLPFGSTALHVASLGGLFFGMTYAFFYRRGFDLAGGFVRLTDLAKGRRRPKMVVKYGRPLSDDEYNTMRQEKEITLDELLDKINQRGIKSLSKKERQLLDRYSKN